MLKRNTGLSIKHKSKVLTKILILIILLVFINEKALSQSIISGKIKDENGVSLEYATVVLYSNDSLVNGTITGNNGGFILRNINMGQYVFSVSFFGHTSYNKDIDIEGNINLGEIVLASEIMQMDEVIVYGEKTSTRVEADRLVYDIRPIDIKNATNAFQVLLNVPELQVNTLQKTVSVSGAHNTLILVNGVRRDDAILLSISPKDIEKVEVITNPSAQYLSRDVTGVVNIITKERTSGFKADFSELISLDFRTNSWTDFNIRYNTQRFSIYAFGFVSHLNESKTNEILLTQTQINEDFIQTETKSVFSNNKMLSGDMTGGFEINFNKRSFFIFDAKIGGYDSDGSSSYDKFYLINDVFQHNSIISKNNWRKENSQKYTAYYQNRIESKDALLAIEGNFNTFSDRYFVDYSDKLNDDFFENTLNSNSEKLSYDMQIDYSKEFESITGDIGYRVYYQDVEQDLIKAKIENADERINYNEFKHFFYINTKGDFLDNFSYQAGLGVERTSIEIQNEKGINESNNYFKPLPSLSLIYKFDDKSNIRINYLSNLGRPSVQMLNPSERNIDSLKVISGNPYLEPFFENRFNIKYSYSFEKFYISPSFTYNYISNNIVNYGYTDNNGIYRMSFQNIADYNYYQPTLDLSFDIIKNWRLRTNLFYRYIEYSDSHNQVYNKLGSVGYSVSSNFDYKDFSFHFSYFRRPQYLSGNTIGRGADDSWLSVFWNLMDNLDIGLSLRYLTLWHSYSNLDDIQFYEYSESYRNDRHFLFLLDISYSFEAGKKASGKRKRINNHDRNEGLEL